MGASDRTSDERPAADHKAGRVILSREAPRRLGELMVEPPLRSLQHDDGRQEIVEPRVMQVLVALIRADGQILTRDDLSMSCWHGVVVGEDAITRVIGRLRRLADGIGDGSFKVETITKVGYRLVAPDRTVEPGRRRDAPPPAAAATAEPLLAVLAFDNLSDGEDMGWFADGVSEEILQTVARGADVKVIGRTSSFHYRGASKVARRIAADLNATHLLDGSVRRSGSQVRISAHLIECARETTVWSDRFERDLVDVFALQDEIAAAVAAGLKVLFAPAPKTEPIDPTAYELYLKAARLGYSTDAAATAAAGKLLEDATRLAPTFAKAWALLASAQLNQLRVHGTDQPYAAMRIKVIDAAETALGLDPYLGAVHITLAGLEPVGRYAEREAMFDKAVAVGPNDPDVLAMTAGFCASVGRFQDALAYAKRAFDLDPMSFTAANNYGCVLVGAGRYSESRNLWDRFLDTWPDVSIFLSNAIGFAGNAGDWDRFDALVEVARERGVYKDRLREIARFYRNIRSLTPTFIDGFLDFLRDELASTGSVRENNLAYLYELGLADETFDLIEKSSFDYIADPRKLWRGAYNSGHIFSTALYEGFLRDPRFPRLCAKLGLCDYWVKTDRWPDCADPGVLPYDFKAECRRLAAARANTV